jgi:hypothetical protein
MSQHTVITDGFGTFGSASFVITEGYSSAEATITREILRLSSLINQSLSLESTINQSLSLESTINLEVS